MQNCHLPSEKSETSLSVQDVVRNADGWLLSCEIAQHSATTLYNRRTIIKRFIWFLNERRFTSIDTNELRAFFVYLGRGHLDPGGRWGKSDETVPIKPSTAATYHRILHAFFNWCVAEECIAVSPMRRIPAPIDRPDEIQPFSQTQIDELIKAAKGSRQPKRDEALILFLLDTGVRVSELCQLVSGDLNLTAKSASIEGKGGKRRFVYVGSVAAKAMWQYTKRDGRIPGEPVFQSEHGEALTRSGVQAILRRLAKEAEITGVRTSPHTFRHTFAITFLRNGGNQFTLMQLLGHTDLKQTGRYLKLAQADCEKQHRSFSPADSMRRRSR